MTPDSEGLHQIANSTNSDRKADIVFVHGLAGTSHGTWRHGKEGNADHFFWPEEMGKDLPHCGIWTIGYPAGFTALGKPGMIIEKRAGNLSQKLVNAGLGVRPLLFVTHSMGGLVVKSLIVSSQTLADADRKRLSSMIRGIVFCATPHRGSAFADAAGVLGKFFGGSQDHVDEMRANAEPLDILHDEFIEWQRNNPVPIESYAENIGLFHARWWWRPLPLGLVVPRASANPGIAGHAVRDVDDDHLTLVKPKDRQHDVYAGVLRFVQGALTTTAPIEKVIPESAIKREPMPRTISVFIASPGDLAVERRAFKDVIEELNSGFGDGAGVRFEALGWEDTLASVGQRSQEVINLEVDHADVFILAMHRRWGQEAPDSEYSSYTEEEFHRAYDRWKKDPPPGQERAPEIFIFFKHIDPGQMADPGPQLEKVLEFRKSLEESRQVLYHIFSDEAEFKAEVNRHLRAFSKGELPKTDAPRDKVLLPLAIIAEVKKEKAEKEQALARAEREHQLAEAAVARAEGLALDFAERAARAALEGRVEEARQDFAKATDSTTNLRVLSLGYDFYYRTGDLVAAEKMIERWLAISGRDTETTDTAGALSNLGLIYQTRGELDRAEENHRKSLAISEKLGYEEGMASQYGNLGLIYQTRGELNRAEEMHQKSLIIEEKLDHQEGMASDYSALGLIYETRGEMDRAEEMHQKSLAIEEKLGHQEGMANQFGNLGLIYKARGELDRAEEMHRKSLAIDEKLGRQEGMAGNYGNLGLIYQTRGELDRAEEMHRKSLAIEEQLGHQEGMAADLGNLGLIYQARGDLDRAEEMHHKSLAINEKLGHPGGMASDYDNLASIAKDRGEFGRARELWIKARDLYDKIGMSKDVKEVQERIDELSEG